jgi:thiamine kinase
MAVEYLAGEIKSGLPDTPRSPPCCIICTANRVWAGASRFTLLEQYWQQASPARRTRLAQLKRLRKAGEPQPLRLAPLHMDVHAATSSTRRGRRLIDWEYAGDGDVALELAAVWMPDDAARGSYQAYARART